MGLLDGCPVSDRRRTLFDVGEVWAEDDSPCAVWFTSIESGSWLKLSAADSVFSEKPLGEPTKPTDEGRRVLPLSAFWFRAAVAKSTVETLV